MLLLSASVNKHHDCRLSVTLRALLRLIISYDKVNCIVQLVSVEVRGPIWRASDFAEISKSMSRETTNLTFCPRFLFV